MDSKKDFRIRILRFCFMCIDRGVGFFEAWVSVFDGALFWMTFVCVVVAAGETESGSNGVDLSEKWGEMRVN